MQITVITQISAAFGEFNKRHGAYSRKYGTKRYYYGFKRLPQISAAFLEKKFISLGTFPYALSNFTFTNFHTSFSLKKFTAKTVDEDPVACQR